MNQDNPNFRNQKDKRLRKTYGISIIRFYNLLEEQNGVCWICKKLPKSGSLCVDHRHIKNYKNLILKDKAEEVRGLLCFQCNVMIGKLEKRKNARWLLERINEYFKKYKIFGEE